MFGRHCECTRVAMMAGQLSGPCSFVLCIVQHTHNKCTYSQCIERLSFAIPPPHIMSANDTSSLTGSEDSDLVQPSFTSADFDDGPPSVRWRYIEDPTGEEWDRGARSTRKVPNEGDFVVLSLDPVASVAHLDRVARESARDIPARHFVAMVHRVRFACHLREASLIVKPGNWVPYEKQPHRTSRDHIRSARQTLRSTPRH